MSRSHYITVRDTNTVLIGTLAAAKKCAEGIVLQEAERKALDAGAKNPQVTLSYEDNHVNDEIDGELFLESTVIATAIGPACDWRAESNA